MNKTAIKNVAVRSRRKMIEAVSHKAYEVGITDKEIKEIEVFEGGFRIIGLANSRVFKKYELKQRERLVEQVKQKSYSQVMEEVAYTWFNRFTALRFMELNEYLPTGVRVLSSDDPDRYEPDVIRHAFDLVESLDLDESLIRKLNDANDTEDLYKYLLVKQCNQLGRIMPMVFEQIADETELLLPNNLLTEGSVIRDLVENIEPYDWMIELKDEVEKPDNGEHGIEIIGWLYQYYISEKKDEVFAGLKNNQKITKENIPAATQLFTPKWIVKYMVENSLGRLWLESHPDDTLKDGWKYCLDEAEQEPEVQQQLDALKKTNLKPEDITLFDPAMGSGHILVYAFDVLYDIYLKAGYSQKEIPALILEKNLFGLDIDDRAGQLACFAVIMKAQSRNRKFLNQNVKLNLFSIQESNGVTFGVVEDLVEDQIDEKQRKIKLQEIKYLLDVFYDAKEFGSILDVKAIDFDWIDNRIEMINSGVIPSLYREMIVERVKPLVAQARVMSQKYDVVCTNPPYMGRKGMNSELISYIDINHSTCKQDIYSVFIEICVGYAKKGKFVSMITQQSWMFLSRFEKIRDKVINDESIESLLHLGSKTFEDLSGEVVQSVAFTLRRLRVLNYVGVYIDLTNASNTRQKMLSFHNKENYYLTNKKLFKNIPNSYLAYWATDKVISVFKDNRLLSSYGEAREGMATANNDLFIKYWYEVNNCKIQFHSSTRKEAVESRAKWFPYNKGGEYRKWYGNREYVVDWERDGLLIRNYKDDTGRIRSHNYNLAYIFSEGIGWSSISSGKFNARYIPIGTISDSKGPTYYCKDIVNNIYILSFLNTVIADDLLRILAPTLDFKVGDIADLPLVEPQNNSEINRISLDCIKLVRFDWNSYEVSWDYSKHPLLKFIASINSGLEGKSRAYLLDTSFCDWEVFTIEQFNQLKANEEELNRIFIEIYGLQDELTPEVKDKDITIRKADREREIKSFLSYAVGCMFGRYSLDVEGLHYAGGDFSEAYQINDGIWNVKTDAGWVPSSLSLARENVIPIVDGDYYEDDVANRLVEFLKASYGEVTLDDNLDYIAETLGKKNNESSKQTIRRYFLKDFYKDHIRIYKKRPIYWLFDSGKNEGFKALIYMHRYDTSTVARVRTEYLHPLQKKYEAEIKHLDVLMDSDLDSREKAKAKKQKDAVLKKVEECRLYDQVVAHVASQYKEIDLDDGVKVNYEKFQGIEIPRGEGQKPLKADLLAKI
ncbi:BREX-1 system adenine-specific DNA-methyltransferase PglX [Anoxynatronum buryatiense]|uniref:site-specific DNA-methyltransferase (adenine-specific) n=1 Tax=Anoxynatronum buryatiense TaxID=489973 RepID=A0AA45WZ23_9CLOT|nr:BREX-1 system adenine-specific DNA-methyltransferase PglX [Anoxynatronum buryatiense]SMP72052.1 Eco57I restriction-modification methylase [Anoxynatronum buryatiense]